MTVKELIERQATVIRRQLAYTIRYEEALLKLKMIGVSAERIVELERLAAKESAETTADATPVDYLNQYYASELRGTDGNR